MKIIKRNRLATVLSIALAGMGQQALASDFITPFDNVPANHWSYSELNKLFDDGIIDSSENYTENKMDRYHMAFLVAKALSKYDSASESDKKSIDRLLVEYSDDLKAIGVRRKVTAPEVTQPNAETQTASATTPAPAPAKSISDGVEFHGYAMVGGNFESNMNQPKNLALHMDPTGTHQDPRGKMGDLGNTYWHDYFMTLTMTKKWENIGKDGQWADLSYEVVGYGDKSVETAQLYARMGGLDFLPENSEVWAGRRNNDDRIMVFAYNIKEVNVDSGIGYIGDNFSLTLGTNEVNWSMGMDDTPNANSTMEASNRVADLEYRIGKAEFGLTYVNEMEGNTMFRENDGKRHNAISGYGKYMFDSFLGFGAGSTMMELQYGKGVLAQYLSTDRITAISEEGDKSGRFTLDTVYAGLENFTIKSAVIMEHTNRADKRAATLIPYSDNRYMINRYGSADESSFFAGTSVYQSVTDNISMLYEANYAKYINQNGLSDLDGDMYKLAFGPALQLKTDPWVAPIASLTLSYVGGDKELTFHDKSGEFHIGYRMEAWF